MDWVEVTDPSGHDQCVKCWGLPPWGDTLPKWRTWIDMIRDTLPGRLIFGSTFNWPDLPAYTVGIALGAWAEWRLRD